MKGNDKIKTERIGVYWHYWLLPITALLWYFIYPETLGYIEASSFFVWTSDFITSKLSGGLIGVLSLISDFLAQFFRWREGGALIQTILFGCVLFASDYMCHRFRCRKASWISLLISGLFLCLQLHCIRLEPMLAIVLVAVFGALIFAVLSERLRCFFPVCFLQIRNRKIKFFISAVIILLSFIWFSYSPSAHRREKEIAIQQAATATAWNVVLKHIKSEEVRHDRILQRYALLALAGENKLIENLPKFHLSSEDSFYFYLPSTSAERYFNALFYRSLGLYNEYIHQLFEVAVQSPEGMNFGCLRQITDGYLKMGNIRLAEKYLAVLSHSTCHADWIQKRITLLQALKEKPVDTPEKSYLDIFIGSYSFLHEMELLLKENPRNEKAKMYYEAVHCILSEQPN